MHASHDWTPLTTGPTPGDSLRLDLPANVDVLVALIPPPRHVSVAWDDAERRYTLSTATSRATPRALCQVVDLRDSRAHVLALPKAPYDALRALVGTYPIATWAYAVTRFVAPQDGRSGTTRYAIAALRPMTPRERGIVESVPRLDLAAAADELFGRRRAAAAGSSDVSVGPSSQADLMTTGPDLAALVALVNDMTDAARAALLGSFGVADVAQLPAAMAGPAVRLAEQLLAEPGGRVDNI